MSSGGRKHNDREPKSGGSGTQAIDLLVLCAEPELLLVILLTSGTGRGTKRTGGDPEDPRAAKKGRQHATGPVDDSQGKSGSVPVDIAAGSGGDDRKDDGKGKQPGEPRQPGLVPFEVEDPRAKDPSAGDAASGKAALPSGWLVLLWLIFGPGLVLVVAGAGFNIFAPKSSNTVRAFSFMFLAGWSAILARAVVRASRRTVILAACIVALLIGISVSLLLRFGVP